MKKMHSPPAQCNFYEMHGKAMKPATVPTVQDYITHMEYVDKSDHMNSHSISRRTWKSKKKLFSHLLYVIIFNGFIILASSSPKLHWLFRMTLVRDLI